jgi:hypothetical protein
MHVPLLAGRFFNDQDQAGSIPVVIVNETIGASILVWRECYW